MNNEYEDDFDKIKPYSVLCRRASGKLTLIEAFKEVEDAIRRSEIEQLDEQNEEILVQELVTYWRRSEKITEYIKEPKDTDIFFENQVQALMDFIINHLPKHIGIRAKTLYENADYSEICENAKYICLFADLWELSYPYLKEILNRMDSLLNEDEYFGD